ncbi:MAG: O-antigen ligase family protein [Anaerolineae bacterium]|nr:O-antigen ligase family protein [Anaerolineae bacterium]
MSARLQTSDLVFVGAMVVMLVLLPLERIAGPFSLRLVDGVNVLLITWGLVVMWRANQRLYVPLAIPLWTILCGSLLAAATSVRLQDNVVALVQEGYLFLWFVVLANRLGGLPRETRRGLLVVWVGVAAVECVLTVMGMLRIGPAFLYTPPDRETFDYTGISRAVGSFANSNAAASFISTSFFVLLSLPLPIWLRGLLGLWCLVGIFATGSNGGLLTTLGALAVLAAVYSVLRHRRAALVWTAGGGISGGLAALALSLTGGSLRRALNPNVSEGLFRSSLGRIYWGAERRMAIFAAVLDKFVEQPWGVGPNTLSNVGLSPHNDYLAFLAERGPLGLVGWLGLVGTTLLTALQTARRQLDDPAQAWSTLALGAGFLANVVNAMAHEVSHFRYVWLLMAFLFAEHLSLAETRGLGDKENDDEDE